MSSSSCFWVPACPCSPTLHPSSLPRCPPSADMNFTSHFASVSLSFLTNIKGEIFPNLLNLRIFLALTFKMSISMASYGNLISEITKTLSLEQEIWTPTSALPLQSNGDLIKKLSLSGLHLPWQVHMQKLDLLLSAVPDSSSVSDRTLESPNSQPWMWVKAISLIFNISCIFVGFSIFTWVKYVLSDSFSASTLKTLCLFQKKSSLPSPTYSGKVEKLWRFPCLWLSLLKRFGYELAFHSST